MTQTYDELVAKYGEDNAKFLYDQLCDMTRNYSGMTFIEMGIEPDDRFERQAREKAAERGWSSKGGRRHGVDPAIGRWPLGCRPFSGGPAGRPRGGQLRREVIKVEIVQKSPVKGLSIPLNGYQRVLAVFDGTAGLTRCP